LPEITLLIPAKFEPTEAVERPIRSVLRQRGVEVRKVIIAAGSRRDYERFRDRFSGEDRVEVVLAGGRVKGETVNAALREAEIPTEWVLLLDAGDELGSRDYVRRLVSDLSRTGGNLAFGRIRYRGENLVGLMVALQFDVIGDGIRFWARSVGSAPVYTTGALFRAEFLESEGLPENLAEDVTLGLTHRWEEAGFLYRPDLEVWMDDPAGLRQNLLQQARWWAGMYQAAAAAVSARNAPGIAFSTFVLGSLATSLVTTYLLPFFNLKILLIPLTGRLVYALVSSHHCLKRRGPLWALIAVPAQFLWTFFLEVAALYGLLWLALRGNVWRRTRRASEGDSA